MAAQKTKAAARVEAGAESRKGVSARNSELEAHIDEAPDDPGRYLVYADWLQQQRDARGELAVIQHRLATSLSSDADTREIAALERDEEALFERFEEELLGPLAKYTFIGRAGRMQRTFSWRCGFIHTARLSGVDELLEPTLRAILEHPSGRFLARLVLPGLDGHGRHRSAIALLGACAPRTLRSVVIEDRHDVAMLADLWSALPALQSLVVDGRIGHFGTVAATSLEKLHIARGDGDVFDGLQRAAWPRLERLHLTLDVVPSSATLAAMLDLPKMPSLRHLSVRWWLREAPARKPRFLPNDALAIEVVRLAARRGLARLDLEIPMSPAGVEQLLADAETLAAVRELHVPEDAVERSLRPALQRALPGLRYTEPPEEQELELSPIEPSRG